MFRINVFPGDLRQKYIASYLKTSGYETTCLNEFQEANAYVLPVPFTRDGFTMNITAKEPITISTFFQIIPENSIIFSGNIPNDFISIANQKHIICHDFLQDSDVVWDNAYLTAEGLISQIISTSDFSLKNASVFIIGYGKCGSLIAKLLDPLCKDIYIYDHTPKHLHELRNNGFIPLTWNEIEHYMHQFHILINTVPVHELSDLHYAKASKDSLFFEIASTPYGFDAKQLEKYNLSLFTCPGIPGRFSPKTAGEIIAKNMIQYLKNIN